MAAQTMERKKPKKPKRRKQRKKEAPKRAKGRKAKREAPDRYELYQAAVQNAEFEVGFMKRAYKKMREKSPLRLREDFCGTALICAEWVRTTPGGEAQGVDNHLPTLEWGRARNLAPLGALAARVDLHHDDVANPSGFRPDVVCAVNFSWFVFKQRAAIRRYFESVHASLADDGVFVLDIYGGPESQVPQEEITEHDGFDYHWDQDAFNPITGEAVCHIHFKVKGFPKLERAFSYDWRLWTLPELRDLLDEVGFRRVDVYWEGTDPKTGEGNGVFRLSRKGDNAQAFIAYIAAAK